MTAKPESKKIEVTAVQDFSYAVPGKDGPVNKVVNTGDHLAISQQELYHWARKNLVIEGKVKLNAGKK